MTALSGRGASLVPNGRQGSRATFSIGSTEDGPAAVDSFLDRLVANLLSLSRIEEGALRPERQAVAIDELVAHTASIGSSVADGCSSNSLSCR